MSKTLTLTVGLLSAAVVSAQPADSLAPINLNEVDILSRAPRPAFLLPFAIHSQVVDESKFSERSVPEQLYTTPGVLIQKTTHHGGSPFLRGLTGNQSLSVIDGIRLNNSIFRYGPNQYLNTIDPFAVDRMDVLLGAGSVAYGSDALGGVVSVSTHQESFRPNSGWDAQLISRGMTSNQEGSLRSKVAYRSSSTAFHVGLTRRNFGDILAGGALGFLHPTGYNESSVDAKFRQKVNRGEWIAAIQTTRQQGIPDYIKYALEGWMHRTTNLQERQLAYIRRIITGSSPWTVRATAGFQRHNEQRSQQKNEVSDPRSEQDVLGSWFATLDADRRLNFGRHEFQWHSGAEVYRENVQSVRFDTLSDGTTNSLRALYPNGASSFQTAVFSSVDGQLGNNWNIHAGLRGTLHGVNVQEASLGLVQDQIPSLVHELGISTELLAKLRAYGQVSRGFRAPNIDDYGTLGIVDFRFEVPSYNLRPEQVDRIEFGLKGVGAIQWHVSAYANSLTNLIDRVKRGDSLAGYPVYTKANVQNAFIRGFELFGTWQKGSWSVFGQCSYAYGQSVTKSEPMRRIPPFMTSSVLSYSANWGIIRATLRAAAAQRRLAGGDISDNRIGPDGTPGFVIIDLAHSVPFTVLKMPMNISLVGQNILNSEAKYHGSGVYLPGRGALLTLGIGL